MIKRFVIALVLVVLLCGGLIGFNVFRDQAIANYFANMPVTAVTVSATVVEPVTWNPGIEAIGTAKASQGVDVAIEASGVVRSIAFEANGRVSKGQLLVQIDDAVERADLLAAKSAVERDRTQLERVQTLRRRGTAAAAALDEAQAALDVSRSALERLKAVLEQKRIEAPFAGVIGIPRIDVGAYVQPGQLVATLQDIDTMKIDFSVPEQRVGALSIGQTAAFGAEAGALDFHGRITGIEPKTDPTTRLVAVRAEVRNPEGRLRPGQFVRVRVDLPEETGVIAVPQTAVIASLYGDYVFVVQDGAEKTQTVRQVFVKTGRRNGGLIEVVDGLEPGSTVVTSGQNKLDNGTVVSIDNTVNPAELAAAAR
ncbi:efflux RND transporter periplasmic adaptor subunit [Rhodospirillaceae bacterium SYSU D60014]|uniref:efflux RND transporter periplasmic adaptor subunit n=1 Tax=Virgifigura deserti TaxID=2268457 RepID=UPI000E662733